MHCGLCLALAVKLPQKYNRNATTKVIDVIVDSIRSALNGKWCDWLTHSFPIGAKSSICAFNHVIVLVIITTCRPSDSFVSYFSFPVYRTIDRLAWARLLNVPQWLSTNMLGAEIIWTNTQCARDPLNSSAPSPNPRKVQTKMQIDKWCHYVIVHVNRAIIRPAIFDLHAKINRHRPL